MLSPTVPRFLSLFVVASVVACNAPRAEVRATAQPTPAATEPKPAVLTATAPPVVVPVATDDDVTTPPTIHAPPANLDRAAIAERFASDPESLGSISWGRPSRGLLLNAVQMPDGPSWRVVEAARAWGTEETIASIMRAIGQVHQEFPGSPELYVGNISARRGGYLRPHHSHQSGRDADLGFYYLDGPAWYLRANAKNLDRARTWALVKAFVTDPNVEAVFIDRFVQQLLRDYAEHEGEDQAWLRAIFGGGLHGTEKRIFHEWGHLTHLHVRFRCPVAQDTAARAEAPIEEMRRAERLRAARSKGRGAGRG